MTFQVSSKEDLDMILDIFGGADGGVGYYKVMVRIEKIAKDADAGDTNAQLILQQVEKTRLLFEFLSKN